MFEIAIIIATNFTKSLSYHKENTYVYKYNFNFIKICKQILLTNLYKMHIIIYKKKRLFMLEMELKNFVQKVL